MSVYNVTLSKGALWAAGVCGTLFLGYCIYFDRKRRSDPLFKQKLKERRRQQKMNAEANSRRMPEFTSPEAIRRYFLEELQLGEELLMEGDVDGSAEHFCNAVVTSGQPAELLRNFSDNLPQRVFERIVELLPVLGSRMVPNMAPGRIVLSQGGAGAAPAAGVPVKSSQPQARPGASIVEDDVD